MDVIEAHPHGLLDPSQAVAGTVGQQDLPTILSAEVALLQDEVTEKVLGHACLIIEVLQV